MYKSIVIVLLIFLTAPLSAEPEKAPAVQPPARVSYDTLRPDIRVFERQKLENFVQQKEFQYGRERATPTSLWDKFVRWLQDTLAELLDTKAGKTVQDIIFYILLAAVLILVNYYLARTRLRSLFYGEGKKLAFQGAEENIHEMDFHALVEQAAEEKNFSLAVRYLYLSLLKEADRAGYIRWRIDKSNHDYLAEFSREELRATFRDLTLLFEYVWYGEFEVDTEIFADIRRRFSGFRAKMVSAA